MSDQVTTYTPERLAWLLTESGFTTVAETITELRRAISYVRARCDAQSEFPYIAHRLDLAWVIYGGCVDLPSGVCSYAIQSARDAGWPEAEDLITRQVECLTNLRATCNSPLEPGLLLRTLAIYIDETGMGS